jgi:PAS domain S-box-containing protein
LHLREGDNRRRQPTAATREVEDLYTLLIESCTDYAIFLLDPEGCITSWNVGAERIKGYTAQEIIGQHFSIFYSAEDIKARKPVTGLQIATREGRYHDEGWRVRKGGSQIWASVIIAALRNEAGNVRGFAKITRDLTARKLAEEERRQVADERERSRTQALRATEEQFRLLLDSTAEGIVAQDLRGTCVICNPAAVRILGYASADELLGKPMHALVHHTRPDGSRYPRSECPIHGVMPNGDGVHAEDEVFWRKDGSSVPVEYWAYPIRSSENAIGSVVTFLDITERRRAQQALEESEVRFRTLTEASFEGIVFAEGGIIYDANEGFAQMFGYSKEEVIGRPALDFVADESVETVRRRADYNIEGRFDAVGKRKDGRKLFLEVTGKTHVVEGRRARLTALRDVTEKRNLENNLRQAQKMEAIGRLAGGVAHDFNNLLTVVLTYTDLLIGDLPPRDPRAEDLAEIRKASLAAASLTKQLLAFSRQQVIEPRLVNLNDAVMASARMLTRVVGEDIKLVTLLSSDPAQVIIDPGQLEQVIMNLAVNARDAMPTGGTLTLETSIEQLDDEYASVHWHAVTGEFVMIAVTDTGSGMDDATRARIFEPFFTTKEVGKGTGLGLSTVYGIVEQSRGFVWVYSEPGHGTTFKVYFPLATKGPRSKTPTQQAPVTLHGTETILLAEDAPQVRAATREILKRYGYAVIEAARGDQALAIAETMRGQIHLLLTDVVMPEMSGRVLAERFSAVRPNARVLYMSGYTNDAIVRHGVLEPGLAYIQKPFSPEILARKIREVLEKSSE